jgi:hypothetical protein
MGMQQPPLRPAFPPVLRPVVLTLPLRHPTSLAAVDAAALKALERQYPQLPGLLLHGAVQRLVAVLSTPATPEAAHTLLLSASSPDHPDLPASAAQGCSTGAAGGGSAAAEQQAWQLLGWMELLLAQWGPGGAAGGAASPAAATR